MILPAAAPAGKPGPNDAPNDPHRLAGLFLDAHRGPGGRPTLRYWRGEFHEWRDGAYSPAPDDDLRGRLTAHCRDVLVGLNEAAVADHARQPAGGRPARAPTTQPVTRALVTNAWQALESLARVPSGVDAPAWLDGEDGPAGLVAVRNGLLDLDALAGGRADCLLPPTPSYFTPTALPVAYDPAAPAPARWLRFLAEVFPGDPGGVALLQEWFGYLLTPDTSRHKMLFMIGPGRNGKGTVARLLEALVGRRNFVGVSLSDLAGRFGLAGLLGKSVGVVGDCRLSGRADAAAIVERLNNITGEDTLTVDRKNRDAVSVRLPTRFTVLSNELPQLPDASAAVAKRVMFLRFTVSFRGREDFTLDAQLRAELPGVLRWAADGLARLRDRGQFTRSAGGDELADQLEELSSPVGAFVARRCRVGPGERVTVDAAFGSWASWCAGNRQNPGTKPNFSRQLQAAVPGLKTVRPNRGGDRQREFVGLRLLVAGEAPVGCEREEDAAGEEPSDPGPPLNRSACGVSGDKAADQADQADRPGGVVRLVRGPISPSSCNRELVEDRGELDWTADQADHEPPAEEADKAKEVAPTGSGFSALPGPTPGEAKPRRRLALSDRADGGAA